MGARSLLDCAKLLRPRANPRWSPRVEGGIMRRPNGRSLGALPTAMGGITRLAYAYARDRGVHADPLLAAAGLSKRQVLDRSVRVKVRHQIDFLDLVAKAVKDPFLGFHLAQTADLRQLGLLYYVVASSETLGDAWEHGARYASAMNQGLSLTYLQSRKITMVFDYVAVPRHVDRHQIEFCMTALIRVCRQITDRKLVPLRVAFTHHRGDDPSELSAFFGCRVEFGRTSDCLTFGGGVRHLPIVSADPYLNEILIANGEEVFARRKNNRGWFCSDVENAIVPLLPHGMARAGEIARRLGVSKRTLARRLSVDGLTFSDILHRLRGDLARRYLADSDLTISQVAWLVGYQEVSAFTHAFKRWTGTTPRDARGVQDDVRS
jgi:AraC-like DNA-binding protein